MLFDGMVDGEDNPELFEDIKEGFVEDYIPLPGQYDINEYRIMEEFIYEFPEGKNQNVLAGAIQGRGACMRKVISLGEELEYEEALPLMAVEFVRNSQYTVLPFPFKYLREYIEQC